MRFVGLPAAVLALGAFFAAVTDRPGSAEGEAAIPATQVERAPRQIGTRDGAPLYRKEFLSPVYTVDAIYKSMMGPQSTLEFAVAPDVSELLWIAGYEAVMKEADGVTDSSQEFMCHSNLDVDAPSYHRRYPTRVFKTPRLFTLSQGQLEIRFPEGFGMPMMSTEKMNLTTQVLNLNVVAEPFGVRHQVSLDYVRDADLEKPLKPLIPRSVQAMVLVDGDHPYFSITKEELDEQVHGPGCLVREHAGEDHEFSTDRYGQKFTGFWYVPPGRHENVSQATRLLKLPYDTTVHYIAVHLHPYAESMELRDATLGKTVFKSAVRQAEGKIGLSEVEYFTSAEGVPVYKDHEYQLITIYNNTSGEQQDSMAVMHLYLLAKDLYDFDFRPKKSATAGATGS